MPYPASTSERQRQLSTSLSINTPSQSKMMRSGFIIASFPIPIRAYTHGLGNNPSQYLRAAGQNPRRKQVPLSFDGSPWRVSTDYERWVSRLLPMLRDARVARSSA